MQLTFKKHPLALALDYGETKTQDSGQQHQVAIGSIFKNTGDRTGSVLWRNNDYPPT